MKETGINPKIIRAGEANMFLSRIFRETLSDITGTEIHLYNTDGSIGAARGAGIGCGYYKSEKEAFRGLVTVGITEPDTDTIRNYGRSIPEMGNYCKIIIKIWFVRYAIQKMIKKFVSEVIGKNKN